jgi:hypothetical protein
MQVPDFQRETKSGNVEQQSGYSADAGAWNDGLYSSVREKAPLARLGAHFPSLTARTNQFRPDSKRSIRLKVDD